jgi:hypothetical protein
MLDPESGGTGRDWLDDVRGDSTSSADGGLHNKGTRHKSLPRLQAGQYAYCTSSRRASSAE